MKYYMLGKIRPKDMLKNKKIGQVFEIVIDYSMFSLKEEHSRSQDESYYSLYSPVFSLYMDVSVLYQNLLRKEA